MFRCFCWFVKFGQFYWNISKSNRIRRVFEADSGMGIHNRIIEITNILGESISDAKPIENFKEPTTALLDGFEYVEN